MGKVDLEFLFCFVDDYFMYVFLVFFCVCVDLYKEFGLGDIGY